MFEKPAADNLGDKDNEGGKGYEIIKRGEEERGKIKADYDDTRVLQTIEKESQKWEEIDVAVQNGIKEIIGDEFTVKFISIGNVMDEAGIFDATGSIEVIDKEGKERLFYVDHRYSNENGSWRWVIKESETGK